LFAISALLGAVPLALVLRLGRGRRGAATARAPGWMLAGLEDVVQRHMVVSVFFGLGSGTIFAFLPTFAQSLAVTTLSLFYTAYAGAAVAVRVFGGRLIDTHGRRAVIVPSMFLQASAPALLAVVGILVTRTSTAPPCRWDCRARRPRAPEAAGYTGERCPSSKPTVSAGRCSAGSRTSLPSSARSSAISRAASRPTSSPACPSTTSAASRRPRPRCGASPTR